MRRKMTSRSRGEADDRIDERSFDFPVAMQWIDAVERKPGFHQPSAISIDVNPQL